MTTKIDSQLGQRVVDTIKTASELLEVANTDLQKSQAKLAAEAADHAKALPLALAAIDKLASTVIDGEPLILPGDLPAFRAAMQTKEGMATTLRDVVHTLADRASHTTSKVAGEMGQPSQAHDPYGQTGRPQAAGFAGLPHTRSFF